MSIQSAPFTLAGEHNPCLSISVTGYLKAEEAADLRKEVDLAGSSDFETIYIDIREVAELDLAGVNELIHSSYTLKNASKDLVLLYKQTEHIEKWIQTSGLDKFVKTAIVPQ